LYCINDADTKPDATQEKCHAFVIDPSRKVRLVRTYPAAMGCDFVSLQVAIEEMQRADSRATGEDSRSGRPGTETAASYA
jgi:alkyl hydroperoxide reductase subunit AhpC